MQHRQFHRFIYQLQHKYLTLNNIVIVVAALIAFGFVWGSLGVMERNYTLQRTLDQKNREFQVAKLQVRTLELKSAYYKTTEYQELAARQYLGLGSNGEKVLILPRSTSKLTTNEQLVVPQATKTSTIQPSNFQQWMDFLLGNNSASIE